MQVKIRQWGCKSFFAVPKVASLAKKCTKGFFRWLFRIETKHIFILLTYLCKKKLFCTLLPLFRKHLLFLFICCFISASIREIGGRCARAADNALPSSSSPCYMTHTRPIQRGKAGKWEEEEEGKSNATCYSPTVLLTLGLPAAAEKRPLSFPLSWLLHARNTWDSPNY